MKNKISETWELLNQPIYTGERLKQNLIALTAAGFLCGFLGLVLMLINLLIGKMGMFVGAAVTFLFGAGCSYCAGVLKNRNLAIFFPITFCAIVFTVYTVTGAGDGSGILWTFLAPVGVCYFVSVKYGILLSVYYGLLFVLLFYTPIKDYMSLPYTNAFLMRFPLMYIGAAGLTAVAMIQYHRSVIFENDYANHLNSEVEKQTRVARERADRLESMSEEMVQTLAVTIDAKDRYTNGHSFRVSWYASALAEKLGWQEEELKALRREALLHDIGKIGVPDAVLNKPGKLTDEEYAVIKSHTTVGSDILERTRNLHDAALVARHHHERFDGRGYPDGLKGEEIPLHARVVTIADTYDAMHSDRIYRKGLSYDLIHSELVKGRGSQFDPTLLDVFLPLFESGELDRVVDRETQKLNAGETMNTY